MSKSFKGWLKYKHDTYISNDIKLNIKKENGEINSHEYVERSNKYMPQLKDLYRGLNELNEFPWSGDYNEMKEVIQRDLYLLREVEYRLLCTIKCSIVLYEQYKMKKNKYKLENMEGAHLFHDIYDDDKFIDVKDRIISDLKKNIIYHKVQGEINMFGNRGHPIDNLYESDESDESDDY